jgi:hypothetical protein
MNPIVASGAASLAGVLISKVAGHSSSSSGNVQLNPKDFERALNKAAGSKERHALEQQASDLRHRLMHRPEVEAAIYSQPSGSVSGIQLSADGSISLRTSAGAVPIQLGSATREMAQALYSVSAVQPSSGAASFGTATQAPLILPVEGAQGVALR